MKKTSYKEKSPKDLVKALFEKRDALRKLKFGQAGSKARDVKAVRNTKKEVARIMTEINRPEVTTK